jgi:ATP-dependent RNA helicase DeaD
MERFRIEVGRQHNVKPGNIVGAIANEAGLDAKFIGHIDIQGNYSFVDLPKDMPQDVFLDLKKIRVCGQRLNLSRAEKEGMKPPRRKKSRKK